VGRLRSGSPRFIMVGAPKHFLSGFDTAHKAPGLYWPICPFWYAIQATALTPDLPIVVLTRPTPVQPLELLKVALYASNVGLGLGIIATWSMAHASRARHMSAIDPPVRPLIFLLHPFTHAPTLAGNRSPITSIDSLHSGHVESKGPGRWRAQWPALPLGP
jgi:hypothetical protein